MAAILNVHLDYPPKPDDLAHLCERLVPGIQITVGPELPNPADYHVLVAGRPDREQILASSQLQLLVVPWAGIPETTRDLMADFSDIAVHNLHHNAQPVAELTIALLLAAAKSIVRLDQSLRRDDWTPRYERRSALLLAGRTALILGYGTIGREVGRLCRALGMHVIGVRRSAPADRAAEPVEIHSIDDLPDLLPRADALIICLPHTSETDGLIGERELQRLPLDALLVNMGRGPIVDEAALYSALRERRLYGAGLDVWYNYPTDQDSRPNTPPASYPFGELDNLVLSPHRGGQSDATERLRMEDLAGLLNAAREGRPIPNRVDLEAGY